MLHSCPSASKCRQGARRSIQYLSRTRYSSRQRRTILTKPWQSKILRRYVGDTKGEMFLLTSLRRYSQQVTNALVNSAIDNSIPRYDAAQTKHEKSGVVLSIFQLLSSENCRFLKKNEEDGTFSQIEDKDARQKISHALRYRKQNKSEPSLFSAAAKKARSESHNATFPRVKSACAPSTSALLSTSTARQNPNHHHHHHHSHEAMGCIFSDEELDSVAPHEFPSSLASFQHYSEQDDELGDDTRAKKDEGDVFPW